VISLHRFFTSHLAKLSTSQLHETRYGLICWRSVDRALPAKSSNDHLNAVITREKAVMM
jgi:hypothetical protein